MSEQDEAGRPIAQQNVVERQRADGSLPSGHLLGDAFRGFGVVAAAGLMIGFVALLAVAGVVAATLAPDRGPRSAP